MLSTIVIIGSKAGQRHIELGFAGIDTGGIDGILTHLRRPFLAMRTLGSVNHPGPMKSRPRSRSGAAHDAKEHTIRRPAGPPRPASHPGPFPHQPPPLSAPPHHTTEASTPPRRRA